VAYRLTLLFGNSGDQWSGLGRGWMWAEENNLWPHLDVDSKFDDFRFSFSLFL
jgi:hypothetical protein